jgi:hypothetical protein
LTNHWTFSRRVTTARNSTQALRDCHAILSSPTATDAARTADDIGLLSPGGTITPIGPDNVILRRPRNPLLAAIRIHALAPSLSPTTQLMLGCGSRWPRYPIREAEKDGLAAAARASSRTARANPGMDPASLVAHHNLAQQQHGTARH